MSPSQPYCCKIYWWHWSQKKFQTTERSSEHCWGHNPEVEKKHHFTINQLWPGAPDKISYRCEKNNQKSCRRAKGHLWRATEILEGAGTIVSMKTISNALNWPVYMITIQDCIAEENPYWSMFKACWTTFRQTCKKYWGSTVWSDDFLDIIIHTMIRGQKGISCHPKNPNSEVRSIYVLTLENNCVRNKWDFHTKCTMHKGQWKQHANLTMASTW